MRRARGCGGCSTSAGIFTGHAPSSRHPDFVSYGKISAMLQQTGYPRMEPRFPECAQGQHTAILQSLDRVEAQWRSSTKTPVWKNCVERASVLTAEIP